MNSLTMNPFQKREQFAVSLRKKKKQELLASKRRKILINFQNSNLPTDFDQCKVNQEILNSMATENQLTSLLNIFQFDVKTHTDLNRLILQLECFKHITNSDISTNFELNNQELNLVSLKDCFFNHPHSLKGLLTILSNTTGQEDLFKVYTLAIEILQSAQFEPHVCQTLNELGLPSTINELCMQCLISPDLIIKTQGFSLDQTRLNLLKQVLRLIANQISDTDARKKKFYLMEDGLHKTVQLIYQSYKTVLDSQAFQLIVWCLSVMSNELEQCDQADLIQQIVPFASFLQDATSRLDAILNKEIPLTKERQPTYVYDLVTLLFNFNKSLLKQSQASSINQSQSKELLESLVKVLEQVYNVQNNYLIEKLVLYFGDLANDDQICAHLTKNTNLISILQEILRFGDKEIQRKTLWLLNNITLTGNDEAIIVIEQQGMINLIGNLIKSYHIEVRIEALNVIVAFLLTLNDIDLILEQHEVLVTFQEMFEQQNDSKLIKMALYGLDQALKKSQVARHEWEMMNGQEILQQLQIDQDHEIISLAGEIVQKFYHLSKQTDLDFEIENNGILKI